MEAPRQPVGAGAYPLPPLGHLLSDEPLPFGKLVLGQADYGEFACSKSTASWLMGGAMTHIDGKKVELRVKDECVGGHNVWVGFWSQDEPC